MMKVQGPGSFRPVDSKKTEKKSGSNGPAFSSHLKVDADNTVQDTGAVQTVASVDALLTIQEDNSEEQSRRHAMRRGHDLLDQLEGLRNGLINGRIPIEQIERLMRQVQGQAASSSDPKLQSILKDIEVRAAVELAKMEKEMESLAGQG